MMQARASVGLPDCCVGWPPSPIRRQLADSLAAKTYIGSFKYMSPERSVGAAYDCSSDVWSLGLVLLECALGRYPFTDASAQIALVMSLTEGELPAPPRDATPAFAAFLSRCIDREPARRATAVELLDSDWLAEQGALSLEDARRLVRDWLVAAGMVPPQPSQPPQPRQQQQQEQQQQESAASLARPGQPEQPRSQPP
jgi:serine/threonine protein kinase